MAATASENTTLVTAITEGQRAKPMYHRGVKMSTVASATISGDGTNKIHICPVPYHCVLKEITIYGTAEIPANAKLGIFGMSSNNTVISETQIKELLTLDSSAISANTATVLIPGQLPSTSLYTFLEGETAFSTFKDERSGMLALVVDSIPAGTYTFSVDWCEQIIGGTGSEIAVGKTAGSL